MISDNRAKVFDLYDLKNFQSEIAASLVENPTSNFTLFSLRQNHLKLIEKKNWVFKSEWTILAAVRKTFRKLKFWTTLYDNAPAPCIQYVRHEMRLPGNF